MKTYAIAAWVISFSVLATAADSPLPTFGGEKIGVPPLSLSGSLAPKATSPNSPRAGRAVTDLSDPNAQSVPAPNLGAPLLQRPTLPRPQSAPRISRSAGMPVIEPRDDVDYKLKIVPPDPNIDFKMTIREPAGNPEPVPKKK